MFNNVHQWHAIKNQFIVFHFKLFLRELESLRNQIDVLGFHLLMILKIFSGKNT